MEWLSKRINLQINMRKFFAMVPRLLMSLLEYCDGRGTQALGLTCRPKVVFGIHYSSNSALRHIAQYHQTAGASLIAVCSIFFDSCLVFFFLQKLCCECI